MIVYLDVILFLDALVNFIFLYFINKIFDNKINYWRIALVSVLSGIFICISIFSKFVLILSKIVGGAVILLFSIKSTIKERKIIEISLFYALNLALVGFLSTFKVTKWYMLIVALITIFSIFILENFKKYYIKLLDITYNVSIKWNNSFLKLEAILDTGNNAYYNGLPIVFIHNKFQDNSFEYILIPIETVSGVDYVYGYEEKDFHLKIGKKTITKKVVICYSEINCDCIIGKDLIV